MRKELDATIVSPTLHWKPYPAYKPSGIEWLGKIPEHWETRRLKRTVCKIRNGVWGDEPNGTNDIECVRVADFDREKFLTRLDGLTLRSIAPSDRRGRMLHAGDLLIEKSGGGDQQPAGVVVSWVSEQPAVCSNFIARIKITPEFDSRFLVYLHAHLYSRRVNARSIKQTTGIQNLDAEAYFNERAAFPGIDEQRAIAAFLDRETARIDALIEKKRRQIELLQEKRTALISHAVTKGLDPNAKMKPSGIEWLGEIPADWKIQRIKYCAQLIMGQSPPSDECNEDGRGLPFLQGCAEFGSVSPTPKQFCETPRKTVIASDILISVRAPVGALNIADQQYGIGRGLCAIRASDPVIDRRYCWHLLEALRWQLDIVSSGSTYDAVSAEDVGNIRAIIPSILEQRAIAAFLDRETARIDALIGKIEKSIELLREYRSALISAAVTGKIDVRDQ